MRSHYAKSDERLLAQADAAADRVDNRIAHQWQRLLELIKNPARYHRLTYHWALAIFEEISSAVGNSLRHSFTDLFFAGRQSAAQNLAATIPVASQRRQLANRFALRESIDLLEDAPPFDITWTDLLAMFRNWQDNPDETPADQIQQLFAAVMFPAPSEQHVNTLMDAFVKPWASDALGDQEKRMPADLASMLANALSQGKNQQEAAKIILPYVDGSRVRARRAARTFGMYVAHEGQNDCHAQLGDLLIGYQVHAVSPMDIHVRPKHRERNLRKYYFNPGPGEYSMAECPNPPVEEDGSIAFCCRCFRTPLLRD